MAKWRRNESLGKALGREGKSIAKGAAKGLGKLGTGAVKSVVGELASILTLGLYKRPRL